MICATAKSSPARHFFVYALTWLVLFVSPRGSFGFGPYYSCNNSFSYLDPIIVSYLRDDPTLETLKIAFENWEKQPCSLGKTGDTHESITRAACERFLKDALGVDLNAAISKAIDEIVQHNAEVDLNQTIASAHFDSESFDRGQHRVELFREQLRKALEAADGRLARVQLGAILHTLQDFYSHTDWVELGENRVHPYIGKPDGSKRLNWVDPGQTAYEWPNGSVCEDITIPFSSTVIPFCNVELLPGVLTTKGLTSGYYRQKGSSTLIPAGKARHGGVGDDQTLAVDISQAFTGRVFKNIGINKDSTLFLISPHHQLHTDAARLAKEATFRFLYELLTVEPRISCDELGYLFNIDLSPRKIIAETGDNLTGFGTVSSFLTTVSINNRGDVSFVAQSSGTGNNKALTVELSDDLLRFGHPNPKVITAPGRFSQFHQMNDRREFVTQQILASGTTFFTRIRKWKLDGSFTNVFNAGVSSVPGISIIDFGGFPVPLPILTIIPVNLPYDTVYSPALNNYGDMSFAASGGTAGNLVSVLFSEPFNSTRDWVAAVNGNTLPLRSSVSDLGEIAVRLDNNVQQGPIVLIKPRNHSIDLVAGGPRDGLKKLSEFPAISDDGWVVAFYGVDSNGMAGPYLAIPTFGLVLSLVDPSSSPSNFVGVFDQVQSSRACVNRLTGIKSKDFYRVLCKGLTKTASGGTALALFTIDVDFTKLADIRINPPELVLAIGEKFYYWQGTTLLSDKVSSFEIYDSINQRGDIAYWVSLENGKQFIVRDRACPIPLDIDTLRGFSLKAMQAEDQAEPDVFAVEFLEERGRPGHVGLFPSSGAVVAGTATSVRVRTSGALTDLTLELRNAADEVIQSQILSQIEKNLWMGTILVPNERFVAAIKAKSADGTLFEHTDDLVVQPVGFTISAPDIGDLAPGKTKRVPFLVTNQNPAPVSLRWMAVNDGSTNHVSESPFLLAGNTSTNIYVELSVPADASLGRISSLEFKVHEEQDQTIAASSTVTYTIYEDEEVSPVLRIKLISADGVVVLSWDGSGSLESADALSGPWNAVTSIDSSFTTRSDSPKRFFRLRAIQQ